MTTTKDPWMLDSGVADSMNKAIKTANSAVYCPRMNIATKNSYCAVCEKKDSLFKSESKADRDLAYQLMPKCRFYANVVFPSNPDKVVLLEMGKNLGVEIKYGLDKKGWVDIAHPKAKLGRELKINKRKGSLGFNEYSVDPALEKATYDVGDNAMKNRYDFDKILDILKSDVEIFKVSSLHMDETITVRLLPDLNLERKWPVFPVFQHWGFTEAEVKGEVPLNVNKITGDNTKDSAPHETKELPTHNTDDTPPWEAGGVQEPTKDEIPEFQSPKKEVKRPTCFGDPDVFDEDDKDICQKCADYEECKASVFAKQKKVKQPRLA